MVIMAIVIIRFVAILCNDSGVNILFTPEAKAERREEIRARSKNEYRKVLLPTGHPAQCLDTTVHVTLALIEHIASVHDALALLV